MKMHGPCHPCPIGGKTLWLVLSLISSLAALPQSPPQLRVERGAKGLELSWPAGKPDATGSGVRPLFELQQSTDLQHWSPLGERQRAPANVPTATLNAVALPSETNQYFRLLSLDPAVGARLAQGGAEVFGYADAFNEALQVVGQISPDQFASQFPHAATYLEGISWDPTTAQYWDLFNADPDVVNQNKEPDQPGYRNLDTRLNAKELAVFQRHGFVVSERLGGNSFAEVFYRLWHADLPVFISCDALLQAWHRTFDAMLEELEETYLFASADQMLAGMASQLKEAQTLITNEVLKDSLVDADYFIAVARSLLAGAGEQREDANSEPPGTIPAVASVFGQDDRVAQTLALIHAEQLEQLQDFMGFCRVVDFSQFKIRGHYTHTARLGRYFKCLMWLGRIDTPVAGGPWKRCSGDERMASPRELGLALVLWQALMSSGKFQTWADMERTIQVFVGKTDSLTFAQLSGILAGAGIRSLADVPSVTALERLQNDLVLGELGAQNIRSDWFEQPFDGAKRYGLPQTFTVFGQKFVPDSWAFSQTVFSSILWLENGVTNKVNRRVPGALDVAFSVLGNDQVVPDLVDQMKGLFSDSGRPHALALRDGFSYQHNLTAVRHVMDSQEPGVWKSNLYMSWLDCLRALSSPTTTGQFPEAMRTRAWAMKTLNTQLASWTHLRHDTILYAKQSYTDFTQCLYPAGYIEPRLEFWDRLSDMASRAADQIAQLQFKGEYTVVSNWPAAYDEKGLLIHDSGQFVGPVPLAGIQQRQVGHLRTFASVVDRLQQLASKELAGVCFTAEEEKFIDQLMEVRSDRACGEAPKYSGWYPQLFYRSVNWFKDLDEFHRNYGAGAFDALVADVHTDIPIDGDPGSVLHEAVGKVNLLMMAVDSGGDRFVCAGPVLSHYEFEVIGAPRRISDQEWRGDGEVRGGGPGILGNQLPSDLKPEMLEGLEPPPWTRSYLAR